MTPTAAVAFVRKHGVVLESGRGPVVSVSEAVVGGPIRGSWWSHPQGKAIFQVTRSLRDSDEILVCRLVSGKVTFVHRRLWPALVQAASLFRPAQLARLQEEHTPSGQHVTKTFPFPSWVPPSSITQSRKLTKGAALDILAKCIPGLA